MASWAHNVQKRRSHSYSVGGPVEASAAALSGPSVRAALPGWLLSAASLRQLQTPSRRNRSPPLSLPPFPPPSPNARHGVSRGRAACGPRPRGSGFRGGGLAK